MPYGFGTYEAGGRNKECIKGMKFSSAKAYQPASSPPVTIPSQYKTQKWYHTYAFNAKIGKKIASEIMRKLRLDMQN